MNTVQVHESPTRSTSIHHTQPAEEILAIEDQVHSEIFMSCVSSLKTEQLIEHSPRGQKLRRLLEYFECNMCVDDIAELATMLLSRIYKCIALGSQHSLPSSAQATVWSTFHQTQQDLQLKQCWDTFISTKVPLPHQEEPQLALQLLLDRLVKKVIQNRSQQMCVSSDSVRPLTAMESNAIR